MKMKSSKLKMSSAVGMIGALLIVLSAAFLTAEEPSELLKGKVHFLDKEDLSLAKKIELAEREFRRSKSGDTFLTGYVFLSRHEIHMGGRWASAKPYRVFVDEDEIKVRRKSRSDDTSESWDSEEGGEPIGLLLLHRLSKGKREIQHAHMIDLDQTFEFEEQPLYWLGEVSNEESFRFLEDAFKAAGYRLQKMLLGVICAHDGLKAHDFLRGVVSGDYTREVRKNAIFWLGNLRDEKSLGYLKEIINKEGDSELKKQAVFAIQLSDKKEAMAELIKIAKTDSDQRIRKNAIFWLGQKASKECVKALKDVIEEEENVELKNHAVFALTQLPKDQSVPMLIDIAKTNKSPEVRKRAIFWLGQTGDERALKFFEEILLKK
jgi:hypothetical protein